MRASDCAPRLSLLSRRYSSTFERWATVLPVGATHKVVPAEWRDALIEVVQGEVSIELSDGHRHRVAGGDILWLEGLPARALHNEGSDIAVLAALRRRDAAAR